MAVALVPKFKAEDLRRMIQEKRDAIKTAVLLRLQRVGEQFVVNARENGEYTDRTGNLRSSIGYVILHDGEQIYQNFRTYRKTKGEKKRSTKSQRDAKKKAQEQIELIKANYPTGFVLIGIAGMEYAAAVESKGYDVLTASSKIAEADLKKSMKELREKLGKIRK